MGSVRSHHASGTTAAIDASAKWIFAALRFLNRDVSDLVSTETHKPNDELFAQVHMTITNWRRGRVTARDAGVIDHRPYELTKHPPECVLAKARAWFIRHVNQERSKVHLPIIDSNWARSLANVKADARMVNSDTRDGKAADGSLYHHKHDLAPTYEQMTTMCAIAFTGDVRVDTQLLEAVEAGMAIAIYLPTGARGSELKKMHLQSIGHELIPHERSGIPFECVKLTAFECKTKDHHLNQFLPASNPWRCGVGAMGVSLLVRVKRDGPPPFTMQRNDASWKVVGTSIGKSFDRRLNDVFEVAGVRRQSNDPLTYLGRHFGTRLLQHQGGSAEGGAARRGHTSGATFAYSECPLPDLQRLMGNDPDHPFVPAHLQPSLYPYVDAVLLILFPSLVEQRERLDKRHEEVDSMRNGVARVQVRTTEQLNDQERMLNGIRLACRVALMCLVARPRMWKRWAIVEGEATMWQRASTNRLVQYLFAGNAPAIEAMNALAIQVRRCEESEISARKASPEEKVSNAVISAVQQLNDHQAKREEEMLRQQRAMFDALMRQVSPTSSTEAIIPPTTTPPPEQIATTLMDPTSRTTASVVTTEPLSRVREKRKAHSQDDVEGFATHPTLKAAFEYARDELAPRERNDGHKWRRRKYDDGRKDNSRHNHWIVYRNLAIAMGRIGGTTEEALAVLERRRATYASPKAFARALETDHKDMAHDAAETLAKEMLGY